MHQKLASKEAFFDQFEQVCQEVETDSGDGRDDAALMLHNYKEPMLASRAPSPAGDMSAFDINNPMERTLSAPLPTSSSFKNVEQHATTNGALSDSDKLTTAPIPAAGSLNSIKSSKLKVSFAGKRKSAQSRELVPESQRVFDGKTFFFVPNNCVSKARKFRISKVKERGGIWVREWCGDMTYVVVDDGILYQDVLSFLNIESFPPNTVVVSESYPGECIGSRKLLNPAQSRFRVVGEPTGIGARNLRMGQRASLSLLLIKTDQENPAHDGVGRKEFEAEGTSNNTSGLSFRLQASGDIGDASSSNLSEIDEFDEVIKEARSLEELPLDDQDAQEDVHEEDEDGAEGSNDEYTTNQAGLAAAKITWQDNFSCMQKHDGLTNDTNPNATTIEILSRMAEYYERIQDHWRLMAYRKAISALRKQPAKITNRAAALAIPHIGERLATKIEEIVNTKTLRRLKYANSDSNSTALELFLGIYGVGHSTAQSFLAAGHRTLADIENLPLTKNQRIGLEHHADFNTRIPRSEVTDHAAFVKSHLARISPTVELTVGGSYRRGAETSGDVDFLLWAAGMPLPVLRFIFLDKLIHALVEAGYIQCALTMADHGTGTKWHGAATLPSPTKTTNPWRRVDFLLVPWEERGAALIYFTGNDTFNSSMRLLASRKGMRLNRRGLYRDVMRGPSRAKITDGTLVEQESERRIFEILGVPWRPPEHRNC